MTSDHIPRDVWCVIVFIYALNTLPGRRQNIAILEYVCSIMPKKYSIDLKWRLVWSYVYSGKEVEDIADIFFISGKTVRRTIDLFVTTGEVENKGKKRGPQPKLSETEELVLLGVIFENPGIYLQEIQTKLELEHGVSVSIGQICTLAYRLGLSRQKMRLIVSSRSEEKRDQFRNKISTIPAEMFVFVDETGSQQRDVNRQHAYGIRGMTPVGLKFPVKSGKRISAIAAMSTMGVEDFYLVEGSVNSDIFLEYIQNSLKPILKPFDGMNAKSIVVIDNASIHHTDAVCRLSSSTGALLWFLPPYSPDLNPIEELFSQVKAFLRNNYIAYQVTDSPHVIISTAFVSVSPQNCCSYIKHAGYLL